MERLWTHDALADRRDELDLSLNGDYLELHGGRRGVGEVLVRQFGLRRCGPISGQQRRTGARGLPTYRGRRARRHGDRGVLADGQSCEREMTVLKSQVVDCPAAEVTQKSGTVGTTRTQI